MKMNKHILYFTPTKHENTAFTGKGQQGPSTYTVHITLNSAILTLNKEYQLVKGNKRYMLTGGGFTMYLPESAVKLVQWSWKDGRYGDHE
jgi:hypothetical protein